MVLRQLLGKDAVGNLSHLPTWFFIIGYPLFWVEMYLFKSAQGLTSPLAWSLFFVVALALLWYALKDVSLRSILDMFAASWFASSVIERVLWISGALLVLIILTIASLAGSLPIHLMQESDCMHYHYALARQHLILGSFAHIPWAADDLFLLPLDFALSPFWFVSVMPNKWPQLIIMFGLMAVLVRLLMLIVPQDRRWQAAGLLIFAFCGSRGLGIQMGTGMLDMAVAYLFFAAVDSLRQGRWQMAALEGAFFIWSKPLISLQFLSVGLLMGIVVVMARSINWQMITEIRFIHWKRALALGFILSLFIAGPFIVKSVHYAGTPLFPLAPGLWGEGAIASNPVAAESLHKASAVWMNDVKDNYGHGRDIVAFIKHWWLLAVPSDWVNNAFDYPLGLPYLLMIGPFLFFCVRDVSQKRLSLCSVMVLILWLLWWFSSQQARFLYIPLLMVFMLTLARISKFSRTLASCLIVAMMLQAVSLWRANAPGITCPVKALVVRPQDRELLSISQDYIERGSKGQVDYHSHEVAYALFPARVNKEKLPHTIAF